LGDDLEEHRRHATALVFGGRHEQHDALAGELRGERLAAEAFVGQQVMRSRPGFQQVYSDFALVERGGHDAPGTDDPAGQVGLDGQPETVEPLGVRGLAAEPGGLWGSKTGYRWLTCEYASRGGRWAGRIAGLWRYGCCI